MIEPDPTRVRPSAFPESDVDRTGEHVPSGNTSNAGDESSLRTPAHDPNRTSVRPSQDLTGVQFALEPVPGYEMLGELGRGGMGVVYKARQTKLNRVVALKMILSGEHAGEKDLIRFLAEAESIAAVKHPHVVQVFEYGESGGRPYMALEFCDGGSLAGRLKSLPLAPREAAELVGQIARGVAAAHELGIVHRDLKPANVLLASGGREPPDSSDASGGTRPPLALIPKVTDFGLAKRTAGADLTGTNAVMGTPSYMSPEQAKGDTKFVGPQADVWALGVILYECLTGTRPFTGDDSWTIIRSVIETEPVSPRKRIANVPRDLELICLKCLAKEPSERYPTAKELAEDLERWIRGEPVTVRSSGTIERIAKWARRKPTVAAAYGLTAFSVTLIALVAGAVWLWRDAEGARSVAVVARVGEQEARGLAESAQKIAEGARDGEKIARKSEETERRKAEQLADKLAVFRHGLTIQVINQQWRENKIASARILLEGVQPEFRGWEWWYVHRLCHANLLTVEGDSGGAKAFSPDGSRLVTSNHEGTVWVWDVKTGANLLTFKGAGYEGTTAQFSSDGTRIATVLFDGTAMMWDAKTGAEVLKLKPSRRAPATSRFSADGTRVVTSENQAWFRVWDTKTGLQLSSLVAKDLLDAHSIAFSSDCGRLMMKGNDSVHVWDVKTGVEIATLKFPAQTGGIAGFSPDGTLVVTGGGEVLKGNLVGRIWDVQTGATVFTFAGTRDGEVSYAGFSPDGSLVAIGSSTGDAGITRIWNARTGALITTVKGAMASPAFSPDSTKIVAANVDDTARVCDAKTGEVLIALKGHSSDRVSFGGFSPDGTKVVTTGSDGTKVWDVRTKPELRAERTNHVASASYNQYGARIVPEFRTTGDQYLALHQEAVRKAHNVGTYSAHYRPDGARVVTTGKDGTARIWDSKTWNEIRVLRGRTGPLNFATFVGEGARLVTGDNSGVATIWDAGSGVEELVLKGHAQRLVSAGTSSSGSRLGTSSSDGTTKVWDARTGAELLTINSSGRFLAFSPDQTRMVTQGVDQSMRIWDAKSGVEMVALRGHASTIRSAIFSSDGLYLLTGSDDKTARLWDPRTGAELATLWHDEPVYFASFSSDKMRIITGGYAGTAWVWDAQPVNREFIPHEIAPPPRPK